jgi:NACHT domain
MLRRLPKAAWAELCTALLGITGNVAATQLPSGWKPYYWLSWPLFVLILLDSIRRSLPVVQPVVAGKRVRIYERAGGRTKLVHRVHNFWIDGVLRESLQNVVRLELGLTTRPDAIEHPWELIVQQPRQPPRRLPPGTSISTVFHQLSGELLILGTPGSGKTTMLIDLAQYLLNRAARNLNEPVPVILNLSSWRSPQRLRLTARKRSLLAEWLVAELRERYSIPRTVGEAWVDRGEILPLLDGLDEVPSAHRQLCVSAINDFRREHGLLSIVVCSRIADYEALATPLRLQGAVEIQSLNRSQVYDYLNRIGESLLGIRMAVDRDGSLWELLETPLMLSVVTLAYRDAPVAELLKLTGQRHDLTRLFDAYVRAMFKRRTKNVQYSEKETIAWLSWIARSLVLRGQGSFYRRWIQPDWLPRLWQQWVVTEGVAWILAIAGGVLVGLILDHLWGALAGIMGGSFAFLGGLAFGRDDRIEPGEGSFIHWLSNGLAIAFALGAAIGALFALGIGIRVGLAVCMVTTAFVLLLSAVEGGGRGYLQHAIVRIFLVLNGAAPWRYVRFLDYAVERIFLRKAGDDYVFLHRLLMEHFARYSIPVGTTESTDFPARPARPAGATRSANSATFVARLKDPTELPDATSTMPATSTTDVGGSIGRRSQRHTRSRPKAILRDVIILRFRRSSREIRSSRPPDS